jgi:carbonic anhydrase
MFPAKYAPFQKLSLGLLARSSIHNVFRLAYPNGTGAMTASIEFAVGALKVPHVVVCGHTECGAMKGVVEEGALDKLPHMKRWLGYSKTAADIVAALGDGKNNAKKCGLRILTGAGR